MNVTTAQIAKAAGISPRTKKFVLRDEWGLPYDGERVDHVIAALSRNDKAPGLPSHVYTAAYALWKCYRTGRMSDYALLRRVREQYTPYQLCALVAKIHNAAPEAQIGELADDWINANAATL